jgi:hypothetical protein
LKINYSYKFSFHNASNSYNVREQASEQN